MKSKILNAQKLELYRQGKYAFPPPDVTHAWWTEKDWIDYIDLHGEWKPDEVE
jgi:hypothetical protein|tara:strand:+ start:1356 stop:1514 length:159 start_codon:yes stop_codon:yes gene_type:complete